MLGLGIGVLVADILLRGAFFPAEQSSGGPPSERASVFFNPFNVLMYKLLEKGMRFGGTALVCHTLLGAGDGTLHVFLWGALFAVLSLLVVPMLSVALAMRIHPYFGRVD